MFANIQIAETPVFWTVFLDDSTTVVWDHAFRVNQPIAARTDIALPKNVEIIDSTSYAIVDSPTTKRRTLLFLESSISYVGTRNRHPIHRNRG